MADDINVTLKILYLLTPNLIPSFETQLTFNGATQNKYKTAFDEYYTERRVISDLILQHDIASAQVNGPKSLTCAHQTKDRTGAPDKKINIAIFDILDLRNYHVERDSLRYPTDSLLINYEQIDYIEQYKDFKIFFMEYIGEPIINPLISYRDMKTKYAIRKKDIRHQPHHITSEKFTFFKNIALILIMLDCF